MDQSGAARFERAITLSAYPATMASLVLGLHSDFAGVSISAAIAFVLAYVGIVVAVFFVSAVGSPGEGAPVASGAAAGSLGSVSKQARTYALLLGVVAVASVLLAVVLVLASVPVTHETTNRYESGQITFVTSPDWNHSLPMPGFGQIVFNWTQSGAYGQARVWVTAGSDNYPLFQQFTWTGTPGYGGLVVAPGTYVIHATSTNNIAVQLTVETASYSAATLL